MNPIIFMDKFDKISNTDKGDDISNLLIHLTDFIKMIIMKISILVEYL